MARRLPQEPPPPLYFSHVYRLLYWTRPPPFYNQLDPKHPSHPRNRAHPRPTQPDTQPPINAGDMEKKGAPRSNTLELGLEESEDEEDSVKINTAKNATRTRPAMKQERHTDVRKGGYPTFSGHGVNAPGRNVPAGDIEHVGDRVGFVSEEGQRVRQQHYSSTQPLSVKPRIKDDRLPEESLSKSQQQKTKLAPLDIPRNDPVKSASLRLPPKRSSTRDSTMVPEHSQNRTSSVKILPKPSTRRQTGHALTPIGEEPSSAVTTKSDLRRSIQAAATDLGPHFPLPPWRSESSDSATDVTAKPSDRSIKARRESSVDSLSGAAPWAALARDPKAPMMDPLPTSPIRVVRKTPRTSTTPSSRAPKSPRVAQLTQDTQPRPPSRSSELASPTTPKVKRSTQDQTVPKRATMLRPSLAPDSRSPKTATARTERVAQGVRFKLNSPQAETPSTGELTESTVMPGIASPKSGLRIPGTNFTLPLPFAVPGTPRPRRHSSVDSATSDFSAARPESMASTVSLSDSEVDRPGLVARVSSGDIDPLAIRRSSDERAGLPRRKDSSSSLTAAPRNAAARPRSFATLGGSYLDGGAEREKEGRRYPSIDPT